MPRAAAATAPARRLSVKSSPDMVKKKGLKSKGKNEDRKDLQKVKKEEATKDKVVSKGGKEKVKEKEIQKQLKQKEKDDKKDAQKSQKASKSKAAAPSRETSANAGRKPALKKSTDAATRKRMEALKKKLEEVKRLEKEQSEEEEDDEESITEMLDNLIAKKNGTGAKKSDEDDKDAAEEEGSEASCNEDEDGGDDNEDDQDVEEDEASSQEEESDEEESCEEEDDADEEAEEEVEERGTARPPKPPADLTHVTALVPVRNSSTHKKEWDSFSRAIANKKSFPVELSSFAMKSKTDLFGAWLDAGRDWDQCKLIMTRKHTMENEAKTGWTGVSGRDLLSTYGDVKGRKLMERRYAQGLYYNSDDFPDDEIERFYYMKKPKEMNKRTVVADSATLQGDSSLDQNMLKALIDEEGIMRAGALPEVSAANAAGQKALLDGIAEEATVAKAKKPSAKKRGEETSEPAKPKTPIEEARATMADILQESSNARKKSMALGEVDYAGALSQQCLQHATTLEGYYKQLQKALSKNIEDESFYVKVLGKVKEQRAWFTKAEAAADSLLAGLKKASKRKKDEDENGAETTKKPRKTNK